MGKSAKKSASKAVADTLVAPATATATATAPSKKREAEVVPFSNKEEESAKKQKVEVASKKNKKKRAKKNKKKPEPEPVPEPVPEPEPMVDSGSEDEAPPAPASNSDEEEDVAPAAAVATEKADSSEEEVSDVSDDDKEEEPIKKPAAEEKPGESKTIFVGNLSFDVQQSDVEEFFKPAGEVVEVRFAKNRDDDSMRGFGHVEFATAEQAEKAVKEMNGKELLSRAVRLDLAKAKPAEGEKRDDSQKRGPKPEVFVRGFDASEGEHKIRTDLTAHFASCGEIVRVSIPTGEDGSSKGFAYVQFGDADSCKKALGLNGSEFGDGTLTVDEPRSRGERNGGGRGRGRGGRGDFGGGRRGGGRGRGGFGGGRGGRGRGGRGRGSY